MCAILYAGTLPQELAVQPEATLADALPWISRVVLGVTFALAGIAKLRDLRGFVAGALVYQVLPARAVRPLAHFLPIVEVWVGMALLLGIGTLLATALVLT